MNTIKQKQHRVAHTLWRIALILALSIPLIPPPPAYAGTGVWTSDGPYGGNIQDIAFSPGFALDRTLFVATSQGVYKSTTGGDNWLKASRGLVTSHVTALALAPNDTGLHTLFAGTSGGVYKSEDGGENWQAANNGLADLDVRTVALAPTYDLTPTVLVGTADKLYRSDDGGNTWIDQDWSGGAVNAVTWSPQFASDPVIWGASSTGLFRSNPGEPGWNWPQTPATRSGHSATYDAAHERVLVFGGCCTYNDVWALDLTTPGHEVWTQLDPTGTPPSARSGHSAIYDAADERMIVFGGDDGSKLDDVWALDLGTPGAEAWTQLGPAGTSPAPRSNHSAIYDAASDRMIVFGGAHESQFANDVWTLDLTEGTETWTELAPAGTLPTPQSKHSAIYDVDNKRVIVLEGSSGGSLLNGIWALDLNIPETWIQLTPAGAGPQYRTKHSAIYDTTRDRMIVFGGHDHAYPANNYYDETWALDLSTPGVETWAEIAPDAAPPGRAGHSAIHDAVNERVIVFGGAPSPPNDVWALDLDAPGAETWTIPNTVWSLALSPSYPADTTLFIGTQSGLFKSVDDGANWLPLGSGLPDGAAVHTLALSPDHANDGVIFAGTPDGIYRSSDGGGTWEAANNGLSGLDAQTLALSPDYENDQTLFGGTGGNLYRSPNGGLGWTTANVGLGNVNVRRVAISPGYTGDHTLFAAGDVGISKSTASGALWTGVNSGVSTRQAYDLALSPGYPNDQILFAATADGVFRSGDSGGAWTSFNNGLQEERVHRLALSPRFVADQTLFALLDGENGIQRSNDGGGHWARPELSDLQVNAVAWPPTAGTNERTWAGTDSGLFDSVNGGVSWRGWPPVRRHHETIYDAANARILTLWGDDANNRSYTDVWALDLGSDRVWTRLSPTGTPPPVAYKDSAIYDAAHSRVLVLGRDSIGHNGVWTLDLSTPGNESWSKLNSTGAIPLAPAGHSAVYDAARIRMLVFWGYDYSAGWLDDVWALDLSTPGAESWTQLGPTGTPPGRWGHSAIYDAAHSRVIVYGGIDGYDKLGDVWALDLSTPGAEVWTQLDPTGTPPAARDGHSAVYDAAHGRMLVFGGDGSSRLNDVWALDLNTPGAEEWTQLDPTGTLPSTRDDHSAIYDAANDHMIVFGGCHFDGGLQALNDVWTLDLSAPGAETWTPAPATDYFVGQDISLMAVSPSFDVDQTLFLISEGHLYRSTDSGLTWAEVSELPGISDLTISPTYASDQTLYAIAAGDIYQSGDGGVTWALFNANLDTTSLTLAPEGNSRTIFAATPDGVWQYTIPRVENVRTLILTHQNRITARYGQAAADTLLQKIYDLAEHTGVQGLIVDLGDESAYPDVAAAYAAWDASSPASGTLHLGSTELANQVATSIRDVVLDHNASFSNTQYLVLVGHDEIIPFHRLPDGTASYAHPYADYAPITGTIAIALADGMTLSDDPYASLSGDQAPYIPDLSAGRLVESPEEIMAAVDAFLASNQINTHSRVFVSGADNYLLDSAYTIADTFQAAHLLPSSLIGNDWSAADLSSYLLDRNNDVVSLNQHAYHDKLLAPDDTFLSPHQVLTASGDLERTLVYAMGCHAGLSLPDAANTSSGLDFPQAFAQRGAPFVGNTGYGWSTLYAIGLTERLMLYYSQELAPAPAHTVSIGQALRDAKRRYYLSSWRFDEYDAKVLNELTLYGLPMYHMSTPVNTPTPAEDNRPTGIDVTYTTADSQSRTQDTAAYLPPSLTQANIQFQFPRENFDLSQVDDARYYSYIGEVQVNRGMPLLPRFSFGISIPGARTQGVLFAGGVYSDVLAAPITVTAVISDSDELDTSSDYVPGQWYPTVLDLVNQLAEGSDDRLTTSLGQMHGGTGPRGNVITPTQRLYNAVSFEVYYYNQRTKVPDRTPPQVTSVLIDVVERQVQISVAVTDTLGADDTVALGVWRVVATYTPNTPGQGEWDSVELDYDRASERWTGQLPLLPGDETAPLLIVQTVDRGGNVSADDNGGWYYTSAGNRHVKVYLPSVLRKQ